MAGETLRPLSSEFNTSLISYKSSEYCTDQRISGSRDDGLRSSAALRQLPPADAARELEALDDEDQQAIFANLPVDLAASLLGHFPYYHQYVLLHKRNVDDMRAILDQMPADERMQLLDELPDEAWERLEEEIGELKRSPSEVPLQPPRRNVPPDAKPVPPAQPIQSLSVHPCASCRSRKRCMQKPSLKPAVWKSHFFRPTATMFKSSRRWISPFIQVPWSRCSVRQVRGSQPCCACFPDLSQPSSGEVLWHGKNLSQTVPNVAIVFQSFALFPWLTVIENVEAPLLARAVSADDRRKRALRAINTVGTEGL